MNDFTGDKVHFEPMSEPSEGLERTELGREYDKFNEGRRTGYAQGRQSIQAEVEELEGINRNRQIENDKLKMEVVGLKAEKEEAVMRGMAVCVDLENLRAEVEELKRKDRVTLEEYGRRCDEITKLQAEVDEFRRKANDYGLRVCGLEGELMKANQRLEKVMGLLSSTQLTSLGRLYDGNV